MNRIILEANNRQLVRKATIKLRIGIGKYQFFCPFSTSIVNKKASSREAADDFKIHEFRQKYLNDKEVQFTNELKFHNSGVAAIPIYRCIDANGDFIKGAEGQEFTKEIGLKIYKEMIKLNIMDKILYESQRQGRISFYMTNYGEEACHMGSAAVLEQRDLIYGQYREAGVLLWRGFTIEQCINQCYGNKLDGGKGKQMPIHYGSKDLNFVTISSPLTTQLPQAVGSAYSFKLSNSKKPMQEQQIVCVYFGEGATSEGDAHAAFNFAATLKCPVIFFCRNNGYAISTPSSEQYSGDGIAGKGVGYGLYTIRIDGNDPFAVYNATLAARKLALENKPVMIEAMTYRVGPHSTSDSDSAYRPIEEVQEWTEMDSPIIRYRLFLEHKNWWDTEQDKAWINLMKKNVLEAVNNAENTMKLPPAELFEDVYAQMPKSLKQQKKTLEEHLSQYGKNYTQLNNFEKN